MDSACFDAEVSLGIDSEGHVLVAFQQTDSILVRRYDDSGWGWATVGAPITRVDATVVSPSLAIGTDGVPWVSFSAYGRGGNRAEVVRLNVLPR